MVDSPNLWLEELNSTSTSVEKGVINIFVPLFFLPIFLMDFCPSVFLIFQHLLNYKQEFVQKFYVRILFMIPINAVVSYCQLFMLYENVVFVQLIRDLYEVYVVLTFYKLLMSSTGEAPCLTRCVAHLIPRVNRLCCCDVPVPGMKKLLLVTKIAVYQFVVQKPFLSLIKTILVQFGYLEEGAAKVLFRLYGLCIMFIALWILLYFFRAVSKAVVAVRPVQIFLWIKVAMFLNLFQEFIIGLVVKNENVLTFLQKFTRLDLRAIDFEARVSAIIFLVEMIYLDCVSPVVFPLKSTPVVQIKEVAMYLDKQKEGQLERSYCQNFAFALMSVFKFWDFKGMGCPHGISIDNYSNDLFDN
ncbi:transmembrane protein, putative [Entamoeba invadens IP1]|uniref:transmembrane protein, putative n=1 Tax=Entamoeba invadens IP1 TaxID=370355 RepID=UPI0002C3FBE6|nr:transmembrane protein, putative [Entamoeba invadens IP1]ELP94159.1 transmembrane protein, putative [Entamoeba invadens IP1]|eukprot:XP_004260930.1 transmembrane protein, putative [Entamoeba invadens IP1]